MEVYADFCRASVVIHATAVVVQPLRSAEEQQLPTTVDLLI